MDITGGLQPDGTWNVSLDIEIGEVTYPMHKATWSLRCPPTLVVPGLRSSAWMNLESPRRRFWRPLEMAVASRALVKPSSVIAWVWLRRRRPLQTVLAGEVDVLGRDAAASQGANISGSSSQDQWRRHEICEQMRFTSRRCSPLGIPDCSATSPPIPPDVTCPDGQVPSRRGGSTPTTTARTKAGASRLATSAQRTCCSRRWNRPGLACRSRPTPTTSSSPPATFPGSWGSTWWWTPTPAPWTSRSWARP